MRACVLVALAVLIAPRTAPLADGDVPTVPGIIENGRMLAPLRGVFEQAGVSIEWYAPTRAITMWHNARTVLLQVDFPQAWVDGRAVDLDAPPRLVGGRVHVPLRFAADTLGVEVRYARGVAELIQSGRVIVRVRAAPGG
ncbi:MAG TPA: hypothetical protein DGT21_11635 [Armatimonadetes bacterium]|jgi:hypothetical protein|nr:hypothetical protein [Armatimonadota bacterium]